ncbi:MAG: GerMN domain-containing protein [Mycoplasmatota bacterium]
MLKRISIKKFTISFSILFALLLIYLIPKEEALETTQVLEYTDLGYVSNTIYLSNAESYLGKTSVLLSDSNIDTTIKELIESLIINGKNESKIPNGFTPVIASDTTVLSLDIEDDLVKINFSKEFLEGDVEKSIESLIYTLTELEEINNLMIYIEGEILTNIGDITLPPILNRDYGINKEYEITSLNNIEKVTVYYIDKVNDETYYIPVTKYMNTQTEKIDIIIDQLTSYNINSSNLMSYLSSNAKVESVDNSDDTLILNFNEYLFSDIDEQSILEEVLYTISYSIFDSLDVNELVFQVNGEEICKTVSKTID